MTGARPHIAQPHIIVIGNEKGGTGKSTTAMHLIVNLLREGHGVAAIDLDSRQATLTRYLNNRAAFARRTGIALPQPRRRQMDPDDAAAGLDAAVAQLAATIAGLGDADYIVIDTPGHDMALTRAGHGVADTLITPLNDSFVDLDLLAVVNPQTLKVERPSLYSEMVWEQKKRRAVRDGGSIDWIVTRNRLGAVESRNKRNVGQVLTELSRRIGFRHVRGFGERVIFREMFLNGLTLLDLRDVGGVRTTMSHIAARQEVRELVHAVGLGVAAPGRRPAPAVGTPGAGSPIPVGSEQRHGGA